MITCKEDLINTRIDATNKELLSLYVNAAEEYGITLVGNRNTAEVFATFMQKGQVHCCISSGGLFARSGVDLYVTALGTTVTPNLYKVLTLADFKPEELEIPKPTKTEYTPLNFKCASEAVKFIEDGGVFYYKVTEGVRNIWAEVDYLQGGVSYWDKALKKEEVVQEWYTEAVEYCETVSTCHTAVSTKGDELSITGTYTKAQLVKFAELIIKNKDL